MGTVTFGINISIDGYCDHTLFDPCPEVHDYFTEMMNDVNLIFFGRVMYQLMFPYWSDMAKSRSGTDDENRFADKITSIDKVVISRSLESVVQNTRIIRSNPVEELQKLKQQPGRKILADSISLLPEFIAAGVIDEFHIVVHPSVVGRGRRLMGEGKLQERLDLKLIDTIVFKSGSVAHHYKKQ